MFPTGLYFWGSVLFTALFFIIYALIRRGYVAQVLLTMIFVVFVLMFLRAALPVLVDSISSLSCCFF